MSYITTVTQMIREPTTKEIQEISERRYQKNILVDKDGFIKEGIKDAKGESKRHAYVCTIFEYWVRKMEIRHCDFIEDHINYDADVITQGFEVEVKTKNILAEKVWGKFSQRIGPPWSILIPLRQYDQKPDFWVFGGCYNNLKIVELFGWLTEEEYKKVRGRTIPPGTIKGITRWNYDINFIKMHPMPEFIDFFLRR